MLRDVGGESQLPIWIGPCEAEAIAVELQDHELARPLTHDLLKNTIEQMGGTVSHILISELRDQVFHATLYVKADKDQTFSIDCRPSDAIAIAVRADVPIYVEDDVMDEAGILPEPDISEQEAEIEESLDADPEIDEGLDAFKDFLSNLDD